MATRRMQTGLYFDAEQRGMTKRDKEMIPRKLILAMVALALSALALATFSVLSGRAPAGQPQASEILASRNVVLASDGVALTAHAADGTVIVDTDNGAFVSVVISGLERARKVARVTGNPPVTVTRFANGRLTLDDPASGWSVELTSFGAGNAAYWNWILPN